MNVREAPRRLQEWIFRGAALREARAQLRSPGDPRETAARQARLLLEIAGRAAAPAEALPPGALPAVLLGLYRDAIYWALAARRPDPTAAPADLRALWDASNPQTMPAMAPDNEDSAALRRTLFDDHATRSLAVTADDVVRARDFAEALVAQLEAPRRRAGQLVIQRWLRVALAGATLLLALVVGQALLRGPNLAAGKPFRLSSTSAGWAACLANNGCFGLMLQTEAQDNPWVEIDLGAPTKVRRLEVLNRADCCAEAAVPLVAEVSNDRAAWTQVARKDESFASWTARFPARIARYVRLRVPRRTILHLRQIVVR